jgi:SAM-dependent methyltransferase
MTEARFEFGKNGSPPAAVDGRLDAPAFHRNAEPIWDAIAEFLAGQTGSVLEIGSGTGQHIVTYAARAPHLVFWPSDIVESHRISIEAYRRDAALGNLRAPQSIDLMRPDWEWPGQRDTDPALAAILCFNVIHIAPWAVAQNLMRGAGRHLKAGGFLLTYGPYKRGGAHTAPSNEAFDTSLRGRNPDWGIRDLETVADVAAQNGLALAKTVAMPANNLVLAFERR